MKSACFIFLFFMLFLGCSGIDEDQIDPSEAFELVVSMFNNRPHFVQVTTGTGELIWEHASSETIDTIVLFNVPKTERLDVTYGTSFFERFTINTYREVQSGFVVADQFCSDFNQATSFGSFVSKLRIYNLPPTVFVQTGMSSQFLSTTNESENYVEFIGRNRTQQDALFVVEVEGSGEYMGQVISDTSWEQLPTDTFYTEIDFLDLEIIETHDIETNLDRFWRLGCRVEDESFSEVITNWQYSSKGWDGYTASLFKHPDLVSPRAEINITSGYGGETHQYFSTVEEFPTELNFPALDYEIISGSSEGYEIRFNKSYDLSSILYAFFLDNGTSTWEVHQVPNPDGAIKFTFPNLPSRFLNNLGLPQDFLESVVDYKTIGVYNALNDRLETTYPNQPFDFNMNCFRYFYTTKSVQF